MTHVKLSNEGTSVINENTFFGVSFEGYATTCLDFFKASTNKVISCRFELPYLQKLFVYNQSRFNEITHSKSIHVFMKTGKYSDNENNVNASSNTMLTFEDYEIGKIDYYDRKFYITPRKNYSGRSFSGNNGVPDMIPSFWDYEVITNGYSDYILSGAIGTNPIVDFDLKKGNHYTTAFGGVDNVHTFNIKNPPTHSKEMVIYLRFSQKEYTITASPEFGTLIDITGNSNKIPIGSMYVTLKYNYPQDRLIIVDIK